MIGYIGTFAITYLAGVIHAPSQEVELLLEAGADGFGARKVAVRGRVSTLKGADWYATVYDAQLAIGAAVALRGELLSVTDDSGVLSENCLLCDVRPAESPAPRLIGGQLKYWVDYEFDVIAQTPA